MVDRGIYHRVNHQLVQEKPGQATTTTPADPDQYVLTHYIRQAIAKGKWSREQIDERLRDNGWRNEEIQKAHRAVSYLAASSLTANVSSMRHFVVTTTSHPRNTYARVR